MIMEYGKFHIGKENGCWKINDTYYCTRKSLADRADKAFVAVEKNKLP